MARRLRLEFPGAIYHVINRGNNRRWMFADDKTKHALEQCVLVEIREMRCEQALAAALKSIKKGPVDCLRERKSAAW